MTIFNDLWPLGDSKRELFVAGKTLGEWEDELGEVFEVRYPWDLLDLNMRLLERVVENDEAGHCDRDGHDTVGAGDGTSKLRETMDGTSKLLGTMDGTSKLLGTMDGTSKLLLAGDRDGHATVVDGVLMVGEGTRVLPGVYVEGVVLIGKNCKIGPNCYLRGSTTIGDNCHIGQAVEVKNSIIGHGSAVGHLSYLGDSVLGEKVNFGAGTITSNFRHDGGNHRSLVRGELLDTGRRKFGAIIGDGVHTGIHCAIYPGRKLGPRTSTRPGEVVAKDLF